MKKTLLLAAVGMLAASASMDAAKVYFEKPADWENVGIWQFGFPANDNIPNAWGTTTEVTIDDHLLCEGETDYPQVIFANKGAWNNGQTGDLDVIDGAVYNSESQYVADIVDGAYVAKGDVEPIDPTALYLRGDMNDWKYNDATKLTKSEEDENIYTITTSIAKGVKFKIGNFNWSNGLNFGGGFSLMMGQDYTLVQGSNEDLIAGENLANVTLTFNLNTKELKVSEAGGEVEFNWYAAWNLGSGWVFGNKMEAQTE
ncbi:MAG: hypothetical protein K2L89_06290 [Muribaculaceae bacterium]|nr:hypothetical protein [Muribaculaceae bacterium]